MCFFTVWLKEFSGEGERNFGVIIENAAKAEEIVRSMIYATRAVPTLHLFHTAWHFVFEHLASIGQAALASTMHRTVPVVSCCAQTRAFKRDAPRRGIHAHSRGWAY